MATTVQQKPGGGGGGSTPTLLGQTNEDTALTGKLASLQQGTYSTTSGSTLTVDSKGNWTYDPRAALQGLDTNDPVYVDTVMVKGKGYTFNVAGLNDAPSATADSITTAEDTPTTFNLLANDAADVDGETTTIGDFTQPLHGTTALNPNGTITYIPTANYNGPDSFTYRAFDGTAYSQPTTVTINVTPVNDAPTANEDFFETPEDTSLTPLISEDLLSNDSDPEGDTLTFGGIGTQPLNGTVAEGPDGWVYTPNENFWGADQFTYLVSDGTLTTEQNIYVNVTPVNDVPVAVDDEYTVFQGNGATTITPAENDYDVEGADLKVHITSEPEHGTLVWNGVDAFDYTPDPGYVGMDSFTYRTAENMPKAVGSNEATVTINVEPAPEPATHFTTSIYGIGGSYTGPLLVPIGVQQGPASASKSTVSYYDPTTVQYIDFQTALEFETSWSSSLSEAKLTFSGATTGGNGGNDGPYTLNVYGYIQSLDGAITQEDFTANEVYLGTVEMPNVGQTPTPVTFDLDEDALNALLGQTGGDIGFNIEMMEPYDPSLDVRTDTYVQFYQGTWDLALA